MVQSFSEWESEKGPLYLRGSHEELLNVQLIQKQSPPHAVNGHADMRFTVGDLQQLLDVLDGAERTD